MADIEDVLDKIRCNSSLLSHYHRKRYLQLKSRLKYYRIPIILLSSLNSVSAVSLQPFMLQEYVSLINMMLSLIVGIIGSIELFYSIGKQMEQELISSREFYILACDIYKWLSLNEKSKTQDGFEFLNDSYVRYIKLIETSIVLKKKIDDKLSIIPNLSPAPKSSIPLTISTDTFLDSSSDEPESSI